MKPSISSTLKRWAVLSVTVVALSSCVIQQGAIEPKISYSPPPRLLHCLPDAFPPLTCDEMAQDWGKELWIGSQFGKDLDLYRSITALKRARILSPPFERLQQIDYSIVLCYWLGAKYCDAIEAFECSSISCVGPEFAAYETVLTILFDAYNKTGQTMRACTILELINEIDEEQVGKLQTGSAIEIGSFEALAMLPRDPLSQQAVDDLLCCYCPATKSVRAAQIYNALLPGAGYLYVGQPKTAMTSFLLNALFIGATYQFFKNGYPFAALFTLSLETGWYIGGINGAGIAARQYNESLYNCFGKEAMMQGRLFPILMIERAF